MVARNIQTELLLELVFSASNEINEKQILNKSIPLYLRKLNCFLAGVLKNANSGPNEVLVMPYVAKDSAEWTKVKNYFKYKLPKEDDSCIQVDFNNIYYYAFCLENYGLLILGRKKEFQENFTNELKPVVNHLGKSLIRATEIEQRKKAEQALVESEQRLRTLSHIIAAAIFIYNDSCILYTNPAAEEITTYLNEELLMMNFSDLVHPDFKEFTQQVDSKSCYDKTPLEIKIISKDKSLKWLEITKDIILWKGEYATIISAFNITNRKKAEERLKESEQRLNLSLVVNKASVFENNYETGKVFSTPDLYYSLGYVQNEIPTTIYELLAYIHPDDNNKIIDTIERYFNGETSEYYAEFRMRAKNDRYIWVNGRGRIVQRNAQGKPTVLLGILQDISMRKQFEEELVSAKEKAEESDRLKSAFLANMSHEIRTPLNSIIGFAQLLTDDSLPIYERHDYLGLIELSGVRMLGIINDLIDISKVEAGQMEVADNKVNLNEHIKYVYRVFKTEVEHNGIDLKISIPENTTDIHMTTDSEKLYAILTNLVKNAIKFTELGVIEIGYQTDTNNANFYVKDTGVGIPQEQLLTVFNRFSMGSQPLNKKYQGSGLGLSITKAYIELLGGSISVESIEGEGSKFEFNLPLS